MRCVRALRVRTVSRFAPVRVCAPCQIASGGNGDLDAAVAAYKALSTADVSAAVKKVFSSPVSLAAVGNTTFIPSYVKAAKLFH